MQEIFSRYADGEPAEKIAASLNERGLRTRTGKPFVKNSFFQIFRNRRYIGEYRYKDIVTPGAFPPSWTRICSTGYSSVLSRTRSPTVGLQKRM